MSNFFEVGDIAEIAGCSGMPSDKLKERADNTKEALRIVREKWPEFKEKAKEAGQEIKWSAEYIAAVLGVDRTPSADLIRRANITRAQFVEMKRYQDKEKTNAKNKINKPQNDKESR